MQFCWLTVTVLNILESKRFKKGAFLFWGCMSINDPAAASVAGHSSTEWLKQREYEMNCDAMHFVVDQIHQVCIPLPWLFADGVTRMGEARFAYAVGYQLAQDKLLLHLLPVTSQPATHSVALLVCRPTAANIPRVPRSRRHGAVRRRCSSSELRRRPPV